MPPRLLEQHRPHYAALPREDELVLITSVLGASADWLAQAFIKEALTAAGRPVVFVSFMRDWGFHVECVRKLVSLVFFLFFFGYFGYVLVLKYVWLFFFLQGVDLAQHVQKGTFAFVDGLSRFFTPQGPRQGSGSGDVALELAAAGGIKGVAGGIAQVVRKLEAGGGGRGGKPLLILESPDFLLAAAEGVGALDMADMILDLREVVFSRGGGFEVLLTVGYVAVPFRDRICECGRPVSGTSADSAGD